MLKIWKTRKVTLEVKIVIIKAIAISKIIFKSFITTVPIILGKKNSNPKTKHETLCNEYKAGGEG